MSNGAIPPNPDRWSENPEESGDLVYPQGLVLEDDNGKITRYYMDGRNLRSERLQAEWRKSIEPANANQQADSTIARPPIRLNEDYKP